MPVTLDLTRPTNLWILQDVTLGQKLPYYLALQEAKYFPEWQRWSKLFGDTAWQRNMGDVLRQVTVDPTPVSRQLFYPNDISVMPLKDQYEQRERTNEARVKRHNSESKQFHFLPQWRDFRNNQIPMLTKDIARQLALNNEFFIRTRVWDRSPAVYVAGSSTGPAGSCVDYGAPVGDGNTTLDAGGSKTSDWILSKVQSIQGKGNLSMRAIYDAFQAFKQDIGAPAFEKMENTPKDNETIKGNYVLVGSDEAFGALTFDEHILNYKPLDLNLLNDEFSGKLFSNLVYYTERYPLRISVDATTGKASFPVPQTWEANSSAINFGETVPNPAYRDAQFEVAWLVGGDAWRTLKIGAPPKEFASSMSGEKFNSLEWNGRVRLTDNILVNYGSNQLDTNKYGEFCQLIADAVFGAIPVNARYVMPIIFKRWRPQANA